MAGPIDSVANSYKQALFTHAGQVAARDADVRQVARPHHAALVRQGDGSVPQRGFWAAGEA